MASSPCVLCGHDNPPGSRFCNECGARLGLVLCAQCDAVNDRAASACHKCGTPLTKSTPADVPAEDEAPQGSDARSEPPVPQVSDAVAEPPVPRVIATGGETPPPAPRRRLSPFVALIAAGSVAIAASAIYDLYRTQPPPAPASASASDVPASASLASETAELWKAESTPDDGAVEATAKSPQPPPGCTEAAVALGLCKGSDPEQRK